MMEIGTNLSIILFMCYYEKFTPTVLFANHHSSQH